MVNSPAPNGTSLTQAAATAPKPVVLSAEERAVMLKHYEGGKKELRELLVKKKQADRDLAALEAQIYKLEGQYLEDTQQGGNIVRGFDGYIKGLINNRKSTFAETDRLFSLSSVSYSEAAVAATPSATNGDSRDKSNKKKRRQAMDDSESDGSVNHYPNNKRARVSYAD